MNVTARKRIINQIDVTRMGTLSTSDMLKITMLSDSNQNEASKLISVLANVYLELILETSRSHEK